MSPVSRGRKKKTSGGQRVVRSVPVPPEPEEPCDCAACTGEPQDLIDDLVATGGDLVEADDPLDAELIGAAWLLVVRAGGDDLEDMFVTDVAASLTESATPESLAVLLALDSVNVGPAVTDAVLTLRSAGVKAPSWADELLEPVRLVRCDRLDDGEDEQSVLVATFERAGRSHTILLYVDRADCNAAADILLTPDDDAIEQLIADAASDGVHLNAEPLDPAEFRWEAERALAARAVHDEEDEDLEAEEDDEESDLPILGALLEVRLAGLPEPTRPPAEHGA